jgi:hypothetical protein
MTRARLILLSAPILMVEPGWAGAGPDNVRLGAARTSLAVHQASRGAARRLSKPGCARLFSDFKDHSGRPLRDNLAALDRNGPDYLALVFFYDAQGESRCRDRGVLAFTVPGSRVVRVCPQFAVEQAHAPRFAEVIVIHEVLHSLGLGENPPSSREINDHIATRCGRSSTPARPVLLETSWLESPALTGPGSGSNRKTIRPRRISNVWICRPADPGSAE